MLLHDSPEHNLRTIPLQRSRRRDRSIWVQLSCGEGFWTGARRRGPSIPAAGCQDRANEAPVQKTRRPEGFRGKGFLASLHLAHRPPAGMLARRLSACPAQAGASLECLFRENRTPPNFKTGSNWLVCRNWQNARLHDQQPWPLSDR